MKKTIIAILLVLAASGIAKAQGELRLQILPPEVLDLGQAKIGEKGQLPMLIKNIGKEPVAISRIDLPGHPFTLIGVPKTPLSLQPGEWHQITVIFRPDTPGSFSSKVTIVSNDPSAPVQALAFRGYTPGFSFRKFVLPGIIAFIVIGILGAWHKRRFS